MAKTITFNNGTEDVTLNVLGAMSSVYNSVKNTLRITIAEADHTWEQIKELENNTGEITYAEDGAVLFVYRGFQYPKNGLIGGIKEGTWTVEIEQNSALAAEVFDAQGAIAELGDIVGQILAMLSPEIPEEQEVVEEEGGEQNG